MLLPVISTVALAALLVAYRAKNRLSITCFWLALPLMLSIGFGVIPGFKPIYLTDSIYINSGKLVLAVVGLLAVVDIRTDLSRALSRSVVSITLLCLVIVPLLAIITGFKSVSIQLNANLLWFALANLPSTMAEELFFRLWVQSPLSRYGKWLSIGVTSVLFGLVHLGGGWQFALFATLAGGFYSYAFWSSRSVFSSITVHYSLNVYRVFLLGF